MPTGDNPNSRKNLRVPTSEEARRIGRKGGKASGESRALKKTLTETLSEVLTEEDKQAIIGILVKRARQGNLKAYELIRDQLGEKPTEKIAVSSVNEESIAKLQEAIERRRADEA